jgi:hypothetical protein
MLLEGHIETTILKKEFVFLKPFGLDTAARTRLVQNKSVIRRLLDQLFTSGIKCQVVRTKNEQGTDWKISNLAN